MSKYRVSIQIEAPDIQAALNSILCPYGEPLQGVTSVEAEELGW